MHLSICNWHAHAIQQAYNGVCSCILHNNLQKQHTHDVHSLTYTCICTMSIHKLSRSHAKEKTCMCQLIKGVIDDVNAVTNRCRQVTECSCNDRQVTECSCNDRQVTECSCNDRQVTECSCNDRQVPSKSPGYVYARTKHIIRQPHEECITQQSIMILLASESTCKL